MPLPFVRFSRSPDCPNIVPRRHLWACYTVSPWIHTHGHSSHRSGRTSYPRENNEITGRFPSRDCWKAPNLQTVLAFWMAKLRATTAKVRLRFTQFTHLYYKSSRLAQSNVWNATSKIVRDCSCHVVKVAWRRFARSTTSSTRRLVCSSEKICLRIGIAVRYVGETRSVVPEYSWFLLWL